ncbi:uncharacterized protein B0I36DRAFT_108113 [Microdochium trichocladiopsis]|uniref:BZIP domain-containing protein n=1 Tax=Microdochium trichocladiopsis TaxID=1682393 RepID=A0A9P8YA27_9PEZI|nr:uncharacterized protein B0I36DRAFT_108113 [Microdochium trichocladiopsis]KAH7033361.1 hypothetical protein B0I36DRAFT_108113 [Microdochium trichocladiopsis]
MATKAQFYYDPSEVNTGNLVLFDGRDVQAPDAMTSETHLPDFHPGMDGTFVLDLSSSSSFHLASNRRRQSSSVTAMSSRSLGSESQSSRGLTGTPEATSSGKTTTSDGAWPILNPKPSRPESSGSSFNPIQNSYSLPPRRPRRATNKPKPEPSQQEKEARKIHNREKNKDAADRARRKKKKYANYLEESKSELETQNSTLKMELETLTDEAARIKAELMGHSDCHDPNIGQWLDTEANRYLNHDGDRYNKALANLSSCAPLPYQTCQSIGPRASSSTLHQESPSPPLYGDVVYQQDSGFTHSPGLYGDDLDPAFVPDMHGSMLAEPDFVSDLFNDQYTDFQTSFDYIPVSDGIYQ